MTRAALLCTLLALAATPPAHAIPASAAASAPQGASSIAAALTDEEVRVTPRFAGARITVYGVARGLVEGDDIVVVVRGPERPIQVMRKERVAGLWLNSAPARFEGAPSYYATASTTPLTAVAPPDALSRLGIGTQYAHLRAVGAAAAISARIAEYRSAIVRIKEADGLYRDEPAGVDVLDGGLFRAAVTLPAGSPTGSYTADVYLFREGRAIARRTTHLTVMRVGLERFIYDLAHQRPTFYGVLCVLIALGAGWAAAAAFRRR